MTLSLTPVIKVDGSPLSELAQLRSLRIERGLRLIGRATLRFIDEGFALSSGSTFKIGSEVTINSFAGALLFAGTVTSATVDVRGGGQPEFTVNVDDAAIALTRGTTTKTYTDMTYSDVVSQLASAAGLQTEVTATTISFKYLIQSGSALQFIEDVADRTGYDWFIGGTSGKTLMFTQPDDSAAAVSTYSPGTNLIDFTCRASGLHPTEVAVQGWRPTTQSGVGPVTKPVASAPGVTAISGTFSQFLTSTSLDASSVTSSGYNALTADEATEIAGALSQRAAASAISAHGTTIDADGALVPGATVEITECGPASGKYRVTRVEHSYSDRGFTTRFHAGDRQPTSLVDTLGSKPQNSFVHDGLMTGVVTDNNDPDGYGRVRVMINGVQSQDTTAWARVATPGAGASRGFIVLPEVSDEVLIGFEQGDMRRPVVLGGLFGDKGKLSDYGVKNGGSKGDVQKRRLISRLGFLMEIADGDDSKTQHVKIALQDDTSHMLRLGKDKLEITVPEGVPIMITAGSKASIDIDASGNMSMKGQKVTIEGQNGVAISSQAGKVEISAAAGNLEMSGLQFDLKGSAMGKIDGGGMTTVKGGLVQIN